MFMTKIVGLNAPEVTFRLEHERTSICPLCHWGIIPVYVSGYYNASNSSAYLIYQCPKCQEAFIEKIPVHSTGACMLGPDGDSDLFPSSFVPTPIPEAVRRLSPKFAQIFAQSEEAENHKLVEICGCGYRKAIEYLVKDYVCHIESDNADSIKAEPLAASIRRIPSDKIKTLAQRATWIGNDATHYEKKHEVLDISDMKRFIKAMANYIESELTFEEALSISPVK